MYKSKLVAKSTVLISKNVHSLLEEKIGGTLFLCMELLSVNER